GDGGRNIINLSSINSVVGGGPVRINGNGGNDELTGINQGSSTDIIDGGAGNDTINGLNGDDQLSGGSGNDTLNGGGGADKLAGGSGRDTLTGGSGADAFVFASGEGSGNLANADRITDFGNGADIIRITDGGPGFGFSDLTITDDGSGNAIIENDVTGRIVAVVENTSAASLTAADFAFTADPIVLDLNGDGVDLTSIKNGVAFDHDGDGVKEQSGWVGPGDALLAVDTNGDGLIENGTEIFSEVFEGGSYANSVEALRTLDSNGDGTIDASDARFDEIKVWQDTDSDGVTDDGELKTLAEHGIVSIGLDSTATDQSVNGNAVFAEGAFIKSDGSSGTYVGVNFGVAAGQDRARLAGENITVAAGLAVLIFALADHANAAAIASVAVVETPAEGSVEIGDDMSVTFTAGGEIGSQTIVLELTHQDGSITLETIEVDVVAAADANPAAVAADSGAADDMDSDPVAAEAEDASTSEAAAVAPAVQTGTDGADILIGTDGDDVLMGLGGEDVLSGGAGNDVLIGGADSDTLTGGSGNDTFVIDADVLADAELADFITDYSHGQDTVDLSNLLDAALGEAPADPDAAVSVTNDGSVTTIAVDKDGTGGETPQTVATLDGVHTTVRILFDDTSGPTDVS
ncbi:MAG: calcium-binding protein, partial [Pseudomonadota bacterium]